MNFKEFLDFCGVPKIRHYFCEFDDGLIFHYLEFGFFGSKGYTTTLFHLESKDFQKCQKYKIWPTCISGHQFDIQIQVRLEGNHWYMLSLFVTLYKRTLTLMYKNQHWYTLSNTDFSTLKLAFVYFSVTNKLS